MFAVLIPALNESAKIQQLVHESLQFTNMVLVIDDGSTDSTDISAAAAGAIILRNNENMGLGHALNRGLRYLFENGIDNVVTIDADGAHDPMSIPVLYKFHIDERADITVGSRLIEKGMSDSFPSPKRTANILGAAVLQHFCNVNLSDVASGMRVIRSSYLELPRLSEGYGFSFELLCAAAKKKFILRDYPIRVRYDAQQFFATRTSEVLGIINAAEKYSGNPELMAQLETFKERLKNYEKVCIQYNNRWFYLFPIKEYGAYLCQEQHTIFNPADDPGRIFKLL